MAVRILLVLAVLSIFYGCGQPSSPPEQGEKGGGVESKSATSSRPVQQETTQLRSEAANTNSGGRCAGNGGTSRQKKDADRGEVSNGKIAFARTVQATFPKGDIYVIDGDGAHETRLTHTARLEEFPVWAPDGQKIAFGIQGSAGDEISVMNADGTNQTRLAGGASPYVYPAWSPDGQKIAFTRGQSDIYVINADGSNESNLTTSFLANEGDRTQVGNWAWSPDGEKIAFGSRTLTYTDSTSTAEPATAPAEGLTGIYLVNVDGTDLCKLTSTTADYVMSMFGGAVWSPNGEKIAFYDNGAINVINTDGSGRKELLGGIISPPQHAWSPDGKRMAFVDNAGELSVINADGSGIRRLTKTLGPSPVAVPTWSPDSEKIAFSCPLEDPLNAHTDLCVVNANGTGFQRIATNVTYEGNQVAASWGRR